MPQINAQRGNTEVKSTAKTKKRPGLPAVWPGLALALLLCGGLVLLGWVLPPPVQARETATPDDRFALPAQARPGDDAQEVMLLKIVCLTFDDCPSVNTEKILKLLAEKQVPATFFVTAQEANLPYYPLLAQAQAQGHQIALHSACHDYARLYANPQAFWLDIKALRCALQPYVEVGGIHWLRFPGGSTNTVSHRYGGAGMMQTLEAQAGERGYEWIDWNVCAEDATASRPNADQIVRNIQAQSQNRDICVVLLHDTRATGQTVQALPRILDWYQAQGYHFCTVEEMYETRDGG